MADKKDVSTDYASLCKSVSKWALGELHQTAWGFEGKIADENVKIVAKEIAAINDSGILTVRSQRGVIETVFDLEGSDGKKLKRPEYDEEYYSSFDVSKRDYEGTTKCERFQRAYIAGYVPAVAADVLFARAKGLGHTVVIAGEEMRFWPKSTFLGHPARQKGDDFMGVNITYFMLSREVGLPIYLSHADFSLAIEAEWQENFDGLHVGSFTAALKEHVYFVVIAKKYGHSTLFEDMVVIAKDIAQNADPKK